MSSKGRAGTEALSAGKRRAARKEGKGKTWILWVLAGYLAALLVFTFLSNQILQASVPHVKVYEVRSDYFGDTLYNKVVPISAVTYDANGNACVFELVERNTPLGKRYYLNKVGALVLEQDIRKKTCAIDSAIGFQGKVIEIKGEEYKDGDIVVPLMEEEP